MGGVSEGPCPAVGDTCSDGECHGRILVGAHLAACRACARGMELMGSVSWRTPQPTEEGTVGKKKKCTHPQCSKPGTRDVVAKGLCGSCYARYRRGELDLEAGTGGAPETARACPPDCPAVEREPEPDITPETVQDCPPDCPSVERAPEPDITPETVQDCPPDCPSVEPAPEAPPETPDDPDLPDDGYAPGVAAVVETLPPEGQLVGDEDHAPGACQGWPETEGPASYPPVPDEPDEPEKTDVVPEKADVAPELVVAGLRFEAVDLGLIRAVRPEVRIKKRSVVFVAEAVRRFGLDRYRAFRVFRAPEALCLEFLTEGAADALSVIRQTRSAASMCSGSNAMGRIFPELVGRALPLEATERPGFFLARLPEEQEVAA